MQTRTGVHSRPKLIVSGGTEQLDSTKNRVRNFIQMTYLDNLCKFC